jgi:mRNA-degrading endonuclease RelE of RelBE toxin-antitoxin system
MMPKWKVIYYRTQLNNRPARDVIERQSSDRQEKIMAYIDELETKGNAIDRSISKKISKNLFELKISDMRLLYYFGKNNYIVIVLAVVKKRQDLDNSDIRLAEKNRKDFIKRFNI